MTWFDLYTRFLDVLFCKILESSADDSPPGKGSIISGSYSDSKTQPFIDTRLPLSSKKVTI